MSFLKDFKSEISQAVNELVYNDETEPKQDTAVENENEYVIQKEENDMARQSKKSKNNDEVVVNTLDQTDEMINTFDDIDLESNMDMDVLNELFGNDNKESDDIKEDTSMDLEIDAELEKDLAKELAGEKEEKQEMDEDKLKEATKAALRGDRPVNETPLFDKEEEESSSLVSEDVAEVTKGTMIDGNIISEGSMNVYGKIKGNVACRGKLVVAGTIIGASRAAEIFTNNAKIDGDITGDGSIKIGNGSVIIGNIYGTSAVIAGAIQGDIDVQGPVVIDGTAVIQGNIRSRSVQINNGAAIEGMISQCYAEIDYTALFDKTFSK